MMKLPDLKDLDPKGQENEIKTNVECLICLKVLNPFDDTKKALRECNHCHKALHK